MKTFEKTPAIVLGSHKIGLGIIRALGSMKVPVIAVYYNNMDMGHKSKYVIDYYNCPHPEEDEEGFISFLIYLAIKWKGSVLIPSDDITLYPVSKNKDLLSKYYKVSANDFNVIHIAVDKKYTYNLAHKLGIPAPQTLTPISLEEAISFTEKIRYPAILKPSVSHTFFELFGKKMIFVRSKEELEKAYRATEGANIEMMIQEFIPGDDTHGINYNSFMINGDSIAEFTAEKVRLSPRGTGFPVVIKSKYIPQVSNYGRTILRELGYEGYSNIEFKKDSRDGIYKIMDINARQNLSTPLSVKCGFNFPYMSYLFALKGEVGKTKSNFNENIYWIDPAKDLGEVIRNFKKEKFSLIKFVKPYLMPKVFTIQSIKDPKPLFNRIINILKSIPTIVLKNDPIAKKEKNLYQMNLS